MRLKWGGVITWTIISFLYLSLLDYKLDSSYPSLDGSLELPKLVTYNLIILYRGPLRSIRMNL